ncbi:MAG TPA: pentapeptide repeat-containing protein [Nocardioidaceae bacterium]|nr:pentapeptide repeat-containing protein [Nocardioidaceae bacterium]
MAAFTRSDDLQGAQFVDADLRGARFVRTDLSGVVMRAVDVSVDGEWSFAQTLRHLRHGDGHVVV